MGRPKKKETKEPYTIMLEPSIIEELKDMAATAEVPPGTFARNLFLLGMEDARSFHKLGLTGLVGTSRRKMEQLKKRFNIIDLEGLDPS